MNKLFFLYLIFLSITGYSQVGINTTTPASQLDIKAGNPALPTNIDGVLIPRINSFPAINPTLDQDAMMVYLTTVFSGNQPGFYYWENASSSWVPVGGRIGWSLNGNTINGATEFIGTVNDKDIVFKRFNTRAGLIGVTNTSFGEESLKSTNTGLYNAGFGSYSLNRNTIGEQNTAMGRSALRQNTTGSQNVAIGTAAMFESLAGNQNVSIGALSSYYVKGNANVAIGFEALYLLNSPGNENTAIGTNAGKFLLSGSRNIIIGQNTDVPINTGSNQLNIGNTVYGTGIGTTTAKIGIGELNPQTKLEVNGALALKTIGLNENAFNLITVGDRSFIKIFYSGALGQQLRLTNGLTIGQVLYIQYDSSVGSCPVQDTVNINTSGLFTMNGQDMAQFVWEGGRWVLVSFSDNN
jgi:trimeric autotransporter adhesin